MIFTNQELNIIITLIINHIKTSENMITEIIKQQSETEQAVFLLKDDNSSEIEAIKKNLSEMITNFKDNVDLYLDHKLILTNILNKCNEMKFNI